MQHVPGHGAGEVGGWDCRGGFNCMPCLSDWVEPAAMHTPCARARPTTHYPFGSIDPCGCGHMHQCSAVPWAWAWARALSLRGSVRQQQDWTMHRALLARARVVCAHVPTGIDPWRSLEQDRGRTGADRATRVRAGQTGAVQLTTCTPCASRDACGCAGWHGASQEPARWMPAPWLPLPMGRACAAFDR